MTDMMTDLESEIWKPDGMRHVDESTSLWHSRCPPRSALERGGLQEKTWRNVRKLTSKVGRGVGGIPGWICWMSFLTKGIFGYKEILESSAMATFHPGLLHYFISFSSLYFGFLN